MKIKGTVRGTIASSLAEQVVELGECPWDGQPFNADYAVVLVESLREAERLGTELERALERVAAEPGVRVDEECARAITAQLAKLKRNLVRQR